MTQEERLAICGTCTNRVFDSQRGIVCGLTDEKPVFENSCGDFVLDNIAKQNEERQENKIIESRKSTVNNVRLTLLLNGLVSFALGCFELFHVQYYSYELGFFDCVLGLIFFFLAYYSIKRPAKALIITLIIYTTISLIVLLVLFIKSMLFLVFSQLLIRSIIIGVVYLHIEPAQEEEKRLKELAEKNN